MSLLKYNVNVPVGTALFLKTGSLKGLSLNHGRLFNLFSCHICFAYT